MSVSIRSTTIAVAVALVVACGGGGGSSSGTNETIKLWYAGPLTGGNAQLAWFDRQGKMLGAVGQAGPYNSLALSPDATRVAVERLELRFAAKAWPFAVGHRAEIDRPDR